MPSATQCLLSFTTPFSKTRGLVRSLKFCWQIAVFFFFEKRHVKDECLVEFVQLCQSMESRESIYCLTRANCRRAEKYKVNAHLPSNSTHWKVLICFQTFRAWMGSSSVVEVMLENREEARRHMQFRLRIRIVYVLKPPECLINI